MKKIAIASLYYENRNYGAVLQAYALSDILQKWGYEVNHLCCVSEENTKSFGEMVKMFCHSPWKIFKYIRRKMDERYHDGMNAKHKEERTEILNRRKQAFHHFHYEMIPHNETVFTCATIAQAVPHYDIFIVGSDQVWNPIWYDSFRRLDFVPPHIPKFSYAASVATSKLTEQQREVFRSSLADYLGVSVREKETVELLAPLSPEKPVWVLDPTLLYTAKEWDEVATDRIIKEPYVFCYFLGNRYSQLRLAYRYAKKHGFTVVAIPLLSGNYNTKEKKYTDIFLPDTSPEMFISLIKHAEAVFTDSFHASVFSVIYEKEFFAFHRPQYPEMAVRLQSLTEMVGAKERFIDKASKERLSYVESCRAPSYADQTRLMQMRESSLRYLKDMLRKAEQKIDGGKKDD